MSVWQAIIVGIIQGLTEFLPVSSSGHILITQRLLGVQSDLSFTLMLHVATLLAVCIVMRKELFLLIRTPKKWGHVIVASLFSLGVIFALRPLLDLALDGELLPFAFLLTAALLLASGFRKPIKAEISCFDAAIIGAMQGLAVIPGLSRSGSTVSTSLLLGNEREKSVSFSFVLSIPIIIGSALLDVATTGLGSTPLLPLICGFIAAFISGYLAIKVMFKLTAAAYDGFAIYLIALSILMFINDYALHLF